MLFKTTARLNLRSAPRINGSIRMVVPLGATVFATGKFEIADTYEWAEVMYQGDTGWCATLYMIVQDPPPPETLTRYVTTTRLNLRNEPRLTGEVVTVLAMGEEVMDTGRRVTADGYLWAEVIGKYPGWCAFKFLKEFVPAPPATRSHLIGLHFAGGHVPTEWYETAAYLHQIGRPFTAVTSLHGEVLRQFARLSPTTFRVWRPVHPVLFYTNPYEQRHLSAKEYLLQTLEHARSVEPDVPFHALQVANEWIGEINFFAKFYMDLMDAADEIGIKVTVLDLAPGWIQPWEFPIIRPVLARAAQRGHILNYHVYWRGDLASDDWEYMSARFGPWIKAVEEYATLKVVAGECAQYHAPRYRSYLIIEQMNSCAVMFQVFKKELLGLCWWTLCGTPGGWQDDDFNEARVRVQKLLEKWQ